MSIKISGFTILKNGIKFDYPFLESIHSMLPLVNELVINVGKSEDKTLSVIKNLAQQEKKIRIIETDWSTFKGSQGHVLSYQTNIALEACQYPWCLYLQADEVLHEADIPKIYDSIQKAENDPQVQGLLFDYIHFYGSYEVIQYSRSSYRHEVRVVRKSSSPMSIGDAQSFKSKDNQKLLVKHCPARIFHYGWVRAPEAMKEKTIHMDQLYHAQTPTNEPFTKNNYLYKKIWGLRPFQQQHPLIMKNRVNQKNWHWDLKNSPWAFSLKDLTKIPLDLIERLTGIRLFEYRCYRKI